MFALRVRTSALAALVLIGGLIAAQSAHAARTPDRARGYHTALNVLGQNTVNLYATERGKGRTILLLHGLGASSYAWRKVIPALSRNNRVIALDLKGFGRSQKPFDRAYTPGDHARLVEAFIKKRGLHNITIVGHSFGGAVALIVTLRLNRTARSRIRELVILSAPAYRQPNTNFIDLLHTPVLPYVLFSIVPPELATWLTLTDAEARAATNRDISAYARPFYEAGARHALITTARQIMPRDIKQLTALYPTIRQRTLILWCDRDETVPIEKGKRLTRTIPRAQMRILRGCGHNIPDERPRDIIRSLTSFMR